MITRTLLAALMCSALLLPCLDAGAQVPALLNYQVMLTDDADQPLADQAVAMVFSIYDAESGGTSLWTETQSPTTNSIGVVSVILGSVTPVGFDFDMPLWLEVEVNGETLSPRREFTAAPYAGHAAGADDSDKLGGIEASEYALLDDLGAVGDGHSLDAIDGSPIDALYVDEEGNIVIGDGGTGASLGIGGSSIHGAYALVENGLEGGEFSLKDHEGYQRTRLVALDHGGQLTLYGSGPSSNPTSISMKSSDAGHGEPTLQMDGDARDVTINLGTTGTGSVELPIDAIDRREVYDEPGVASIQSSSIVSMTPGNILSVAARTIYTPRDGYVFVMGTAEVEIGHSGTVDNSVVFGISQSDNAWSGAAQEQKIRLPDSTPGGWYYSHASVSAVFEVSAGTHTFYMNALEAGGECNVRGRQLTVMYFPTAYGSVDTTD